MAASLAHPPAAGPARPAGASGPLEARGQAASGVISTLAGGPGGPEDATNVAVNPCGVSPGTDGYLYVSEPGPKPGIVHTVLPGQRDTRPAAVSSGPVTSGAVLRLNPGSGVLAPFAGTYAERGPVVNDVPATAATMGTCGAAADHYGNLVIADQLTCRIRVVAGSTGKFYGQAMTVGDIYTVAGHGACTFSGDGGLARRAGLDPVAVQVDAAGNLVIADQHDRVRVVAATSGTFYGQAMTARHIYTVAGDGTAGFSGDGGPATEATLNGPASLVLDAAGNLVISDSGNCRVRVVASQTGTFYRQEMTSGGIYTIAGDGTAGFSGDSGPATGASLNGPEGVTVQDGNVVIADTLNARVRVIAESTGTLYGQELTSGDIYTIAGNGNISYSGDGGPAAAAEFHGPGTLAVSSDGSLAVVDYWDNRIRFVPAGTGTYFGQPMTAGDVYTIAGSGHDGFTGDGVPAIDAGLNDPGQTTVDSAGNLLMADTEDCRIRMVANTTGTFYGQAVTAGYIYTVAGDGHHPQNCPFAGDGSPATGTGLHPAGVTLDAAGNLVIADSWDCRILVAAESTGNYYGKAMTAGDIYSVAGDGTCGYSGDGGRATKAELYPSQKTRVTPFGFAIDAAGNLVIPDSGNERVRVVAAGTGTFYGQAMTAGDIYTIAGDGTAGFSGDGGAATSAELSGPEGLAVDGSADLLISDGDGNNRIREVPG